MPGLDLSALQGIDVHVHVESDGHGRLSLDDELLAASAKYFPPQLVRAASSLLQDKVLFGSDYPMLTPDRWLADFAKLPIKPEITPKILKLNAGRLLGLGPA